MGQFENERNGALKKTNIIEIQAESSNIKKCSKMDIYSFSSILAHIF